MNRYNIRIDGEEMPNSYTYEELLLNDVLEFDEIEIRQVSESNWTSIRCFNFPEEQIETSDIELAYSADENGQARFNKSQYQEKEKESEYEIDEYGQVVSRTNIGGTATTAKTNAPNSTNTTTPTESSDFNDNVSAWTIIKIIITVAIIGIVIIWMVSDGWGAISIPPVVYILNKIWNND